MAGSEERAHVAELAATVPAGPWDRLLFSAKEAVFKACFPLAGALEFDDAVVTFDVATGAFTAQLRGGSVPGRFLFAEGLLLTACVLPLPC